MGPQVPDLEFRLGVLFQLYILFRGKVIIRILRKHWQFIKPVIKRLLRVAAGGMGQYLIASASWVFLMRIISEFGEEAVAGYTISIRMIIFAILPAWGMANAAATLVGQNLGANQPERAEQSVWKAAFYTMLFLLAVSIFYYLFAEPMVRFFHDDTHVVAYGVESLKIICLGYVFFAYGMVISQSFNGAGDTKTPTWLNFVCFWLLQIPLAYVLGLTFNFGATGVFWAIAISETTLALAAIYLFRLGRWKQIII